MFRNSIFAQQLSHRFSVCVPSVFQLCLCLINQILPLTLFKGFQRISLLFYLLHGPFNHLLSAHVFLSSTLTCFKEERIIVTTSLQTLSLSFIAAVKSSADSPVMSCCTPDSFGYTVIERHLKLLGVLSASCFCFLLASNTWFFIMLSFSYLG